MSFDISEESYIPQKCGLDFQQRKLYIEYTVSGVGKKTRRRRGIPVRHLESEEDLYDVVEDLYDRHGPYIGAIPRSQIEGLLMRLLEGPEKNEKARRKLIEEEEGKKSAVSRLMRGNSGVGEGLDGFTKLDSVPDIPDEVGRGGGVREEGDYEFQERLSAEKEMHKGLLASQGGEDEEEEEEEENTSELSVSNVVVDPEENLNLVSDRVLKQKKKVMNEVFEQNRVRPGDDGYVYDKRVEFPAKEAGSGTDSADDCSWDDEEEEEGSSLSAISYG
eukprot:Nk52_evm38s967 gene=Nk52_evmTU38s967